MGSFTARPGTEAARSTAPERFTVSALPVPVEPSRPCTPFRTAQGARCRRRPCAGSGRKSVWKHVERRFGKRGTIFELSPSGSGWNFTLLYSFSERGRRMVRSTPWRWTLREISTAPQLRTEARSQGSVFKLTRNNGSWSFTDLYDFTGGADGGNPIGGVTLDPSGKMYGTTSAGGVQSSHCSSENYPGCGVVWGITP